MSLWNPSRPDGSFGGSYRGANKTASSLQLRIITFNIRYATTSPLTNERPWVERWPFITNQLLHELRFTHGSSHVQASGSVAGSSTYNGAFICLQEVLHSQLVDMLAGLNQLSSGYDDGERKEPSQTPEWAHIGVGRDDGGQDGEYSPIIYPVKTFTLLHSENVWLSPTPDEPSKGWDASSIRILTVGVFEHKQTEQRLLAANTHLDNQSSKSRVESVKIILNALRRIHHAWSQPQRKLGVFLTGDFSSSPEQEAYVAMRDDGWMKDLQQDIGSQARYGETNTFTGFEPGKQTNRQGRIDYIWHGPTQHFVSSPWKSVGYAVLPNVFDDKVYLSDHRAVVGDLRLDSA